MERVDGQRGALVFFSSSRSPHQPAESDVVEDETKGQLPTSADEEA